MATKLTWPNNKFLLPAGFLPPVVPLSDFKFFEETRDNIALGYEYYFMISQDPEKINKSIIGGKIYGVHGPWLTMDKHPSLYSQILYYIMFRPQVAKSAPKGVFETIKFAKGLGAKYVVIHTSEIDLENPETFVKECLDLCEKLKIDFFLEPEYKKTMKTITGKLEKWHYDHLELFNKFKIPIVYDPATVELNGQDILKVWNEAKHGIGHIHLNEFVPGFNRDHGVMKSEKYKLLLGEIAKSKYSGFFTFEQDSIQSQKDFLIAALYTALSFLGITKLFPQISVSYAAITQKYLRDSVEFSSKYLSRI